MGEAEGFLPTGFAVDADKVPDAVAVDEGVGLECVVFAFLPSCLAVVETEPAVLSDGVVDCIEFVLFAFNVFVLESFDLYALGKVPLIEFAVDFGQQVLDAAEVGEAFDVFGIEVSEFAFVEAVITWALFVPCEEAQAFVEVALDGADVGLKFFGKLPDFEPFPCVEFVEDTAQAVGELFVFGAHVSGNQCCRLGNYIGWECAVVSHLEGYLLFFVKIIPFFCYF